MPLTPVDIERCRYHLGYGSVQPAASMQFGLPRPIASIQILYQAIANITDDALPRIRRILDVLDGIETQMVDALKRMKAMRLGDLDLHGNHNKNDETDALEADYYRWGSRLADIFQISFYPWSNRYRGGGGGGVDAGSIPVRR